MGRTLLFLALLGVMVAGVVWGLQRWRDRSVPGPPIRSALSAAVLEERASLAHGPDRGPGILRLTESQLLFTADSGRVLALERLDVVGVTQTRELPDREVTRPVLVVTVPGESYYFAVREPARWESALT